MPTGKNTFKARLLKTINKIPKSLILNEAQWKHLLSEKLLLKSSINFDIHFGPDTPIVQQILFLKKWLKNKGEQMVGKKEKELLNLPLKWNCGFAVEIFFFFSPFKECACPFF